MYAGILITTLLLPTMNIGSENSLFNRNSPKKSTNKKFSANVFLSWSVKNIRSNLIVASECSYQYSGQPRHTFISVSRSLFVPFKYRFPVWHTPVFAKHSNNLLMLFPIFYSISATLFAGLGSLNFTVSCEVVRSADIM